MSTLWMCKHPTFAFCRSETFDPASKPRRGNVYFSDKTTCATWYPTCDFCRPETFGPVSKQRIWNVYFQTKQILQLSKTKTWCYRGTDRCNWIGCMDFWLKPLDLPLNKSAGNAHGGVDAVSKCGAKQNYLVDKKQTAFCWLGINSLL